MNEREKRIVEAARAALKDFEAIYADMRSTERDRSDPIRAIARVNIERLGAALSLPKGEARPPTPPPPASEAPMDDLSCSMAGLPPASEPPATDNTVDDPPIGCFRDDTIEKLKRDGFYVLNGQKILYEPGERFSSPTTAPATDAAREAFEKAAAAVFACEMECPVMEDGPPMSWHTEHDSLTKTASRAYKAYLATRGEGEPKACGWCGGQGYVEGFCAGQPYRQECHRCNN